MFLNIVGFETGDMSEAYSSGGTIAVQSSIVRTGGYAFRSYPTGAATGYYVLTKHGSNGAKAFFGVTELYCTFYFYVATLPSTNDEQIWYSNCAAGPGQNQGLRITSGGVLKLYNDEASGSPVLLETGTTALSTGQWYRIDIWLGCGDGAGATDDYEVRINGVSEFSGTAQFGASGTTRNNCNVGRSQNKNSNTVDFYYDDIAISDSAYPGAGQVNILKPNGAGTYTAWTGTYADVDEVPHDTDTTYLTSSTATQAETVALESAATGGVSGTIGSVKSVAIVRDEGGVSSIDLRTRSGSTDDDTTGVDPGAAYVLLAKLYDTDPADAGAWTSGDLDALEVGVLNNNAVAVRCTAIYAMVWSTGTVNTTVTPGVLSLTTTRYSPTVLTPVVATPGTLSAALTAYAPAATVGLAVTPGTASLILTAYTPTVINPQSATPGTLALALTAYEPGAVVNSIVTPGALTTALTAYAPAALLNNIVTPGALSASLTAYAPSAIVNFIVTPGAGSLAIATYGINIYLPGSAFGARQYWRSTQHKEYTKLVPYRDYRRVTTYKDYIKSVKWVDRA